MNSRTNPNMCLIIVSAILIITCRYAKADFIFGTPINLGPTINSTATEQVPSPSADGLELYFSDHGPGVRPGGRGGADLWVATRPTKDDPWGVPVNLGPTVNSSADDEYPDLSADGLSLYFSSNRAGGLGSYDLWVTTRVTTNDPWQEPVNLGSTVNSTYGDANPDISTDGLSLYFCDYPIARPGGYGGWDSYVTTRESVSDPWGVPVNLGPVVNGPEHDTFPNISADGLILFLSPGKPGGFGSADLWMTRRQTTDADWEPLVNLGPAVNGGGFDAGPKVSSDGSTLYFCSERPGGFGSVDLWQVSIEPVVDFNGDGTVDSADLLIMIDHWGTNEPLCDIGPTPFGDGIVDIHDMVVFSEYLLGEPLLVDLAAHWKLDEIKGYTTPDSAGYNDAYVIGSPVCLPNDGQVDGAFQFDGLDDCVISNFVLNPEKGPFRVIIWIKGGAPGQVILSQMGVSNWLYTDSAEGHLMTDIMAPDVVAAEPLMSGVVINDGEWHRVGLVWDGFKRTLYVDNIVVAEDTQAELVGSVNGLYIGTGKAMQPGTYWSGMIDDVRIYVSKTK